MEYIYSVMVLQSAGKPITEENIANVVKAAGIEPDLGKIKAIVASVKGVDINAIIKNAMVMQAAPVQSAQAVTEGKQEKKKEEKKEDEKSVTEEEAASGLSSLFGD